MVSYVRGRGRRTLSDPEIVDLYKEGTDSVTIALRANCDATTVLNIVRAANVPIRPTGGRRNTNRLKLTEDEICRRYREGGESGPTLADAAGTSTATIYGVLKRGGVERRPSTVSATAAAVAARKRRARGPTP